MLAVRIATTDRDKVDQRSRQIEAHRLHLRAAQFKIILSGPTFNACGNQNGAIVVAEVTDLRELRNFSDADPFVVHGVYKRIQIYEWSATIDNR